MESLPLITVIITTYNRVDLLTRRALPSVLGQTYKNLECFVVDDCSTDETESIIRRVTETESRVTYFKTPTNRGVAAARNFGVKKSNGRLIAFLDDEDEFLPHYLEKVEQAFLNTTTEVGALVTNFWLHYEDGEEVFAEREKDFWRAGIGNGWSLKKSVFFEGSMWFDEDLRSLEDLDFSLRFSRLFRYRVVAEPLFRYYTPTPRLRDRGILLGKRYQSYFLSNLQTVLKRHFPVYEREGKMALAWFYFFEGVHYCQFGKLQKGRSALLKAFKMKPSLHGLYHIITSFGGWNFFLFAFGLRSKLQKALKRLCVSI